MRPSKICTPLKVEHLRYFIASYVQSIKQQHNFLKITSAIKLSLKIYRQFHSKCEWKPLHGFLQINTFCCEHARKDEWGLMTGKRMNYTYSGMAKATSRAEATSNSKKIKHKALAIVKLC